MTETHDTINVDLESANLEMVFTITYTLTDDLYQEIVPVSVEKRPGPEPQLSDSEVIAISLVGEMVLDSETAWVHFVQKNYRPLFPQLNERSRFHRRNKDLWVVKNLIRQKLLEKLPEAFNPYRLVDSLPIIICHYARAQRGRLFLGQVDKDALFGVCASKKEKIYGFRLHLQVTIDGIPINFVLAPACHHDVAVLPEVMENYRHLVVGGDKGFVSKPLAEALQRQQDIELITTKRKNQKQQNTPQENYFLGCFRKMIETLNSLLTEQFHTNKTRARTLWGLFSKIISKLTSLTLGIYINKLAGRPLLAIKGIAL